MCGITGLFRLNASSTLSDIIKKMNATLTHRGPDDHGVWTNEPGIALGHTRLAIQDLSHDGHQPMDSACGRYVIVFNGEVYNFEEIRKALTQTRFRGHSDTEVVLCAIAEFGLAEALRKFNGMFALALWDKHEKTLSLARDRVGKKPLYFGRNSGYFCFSSELKALKAIPDFTPELDMQALGQYMRFNYIPAPYSIYKGIYKLEPGSFITLGVDGLNNQSDLLDQCQKYWSALDVAAHNFNHPFEGSLGDAQLHLTGLLEDSTRLRMISDVPFGVLLSGGVDSSIVAAMMQKQSSRPVNSFSIGFSNSDKDEAHIAKDIAGYLGTSHNELYVSGQDALDLVPDIAQYYDEPFADSSQIPTFIVSKLARGKVTVALSGDGGDELFYGYNRYFRNVKNWQTSQKIPTALKQAVSRQLYKLAGKQKLGLTANKYANEIGAMTVLDMYMSRICKWVAPESLMLNPHVPIQHKLQQVSALSLPHPEQYLMLYDYLTYLCDDILVKTDRASMANSLELRSPLLDYRITEFAWSLPMSMKFQNNKGKHILRQVLDAHIPNSLTNHPKHGFGAPVRDWLNGPLNDWAEDLLAKDKLEQQGIFDSEKVSTLWHDFKYKKKKYHTQLWNMLMFQSWYQSQ
ncbi:MAG: asparagine synthase (glutamine-hydrolyzing) [Paraglaciecola polaris]|uniref:asparagine synthase (glutamine-hydrolyzing) n=1 Tax=Paraglaciecola polaris TaxID=222814 RepID=UPI00300233C1|tara:strand:+ start:2393 stop:4282 length:1890 start_codon:yes stop_codon:yes gene_type:complete